MKFSLAILVFLPILASAKELSNHKETYAEYAKRNGIPMEKSGADYQYMTCYDNYGQSGSSYRAQDYISNLGILKRFCVMYQFI